MPTEVLSVSSLLNPASPNNERGGLQPNPLMEQPFLSSRLEITTQRPIDTSATTASDGDETVGEINFKPCEETRNEELKAEHERFQLQFFGEIAKNPRHIPYRSNKRDLQEKTGRGFFEGKPPIWVI